jgi:hypothetical protein
MVMDVSIFGMVLTSLPDRLSSWVPAKPRPCVPGIDLLKHTVEVSSLRLILAELKFTCYCASEPLDLR